tara:strand:- start:197 stop:319 length:123 start_codon:yes stop_codon:yes gene_type:complete
MRSRVRLRELTFENAQEGQFEDPAMDEGGQGVKTPSSEIS